MRDLKLYLSITNRDSESTGKYLAEIGKIPLLSVDEEIRLTKRVREGDKAALDLLVKTNLRFVVSVAKKYQNRGLSLGDLINEGNIGLIKAAQRFDETKGFKFISFAVWWIRQSIMLAIAQQTRIIRLPLNLINSISLVNKTISALEQRLERMPTSDEVAMELSVSDRLVQDYLKTAKRCGSLDAVQNHDIGSTLLDVLTDQHPAPDHQYNLSGFAYETKCLLKGLSKREIKVLHLYFGLEGTKPFSLYDIGCKLNLSKERIRQIKDSGIRKIRERIKNTYHKK